MHEIVIISDLHLGRGKNPETGRFARLEAFFYDDDFEGFCRWLCAQAAESGKGLKLVLNGDTFDLLRIEPEPPEPGLTMTERRYGPILHSRRAARIIADILVGHTRFVLGLAHVLAAGHQVVFLPGNHDAELCWESVQDEVRRAVMARVVELGGDAAVARAQSLLLFEEWFHHEPGRIWIEHGHQYDGECSFQYYLRGGLSGDEEILPELERDVPVASFFQRYLYNSFGSITFIVPSTRANLRYVRWLVLHKPKMVATTLFNQLPFFVQVIRRLAKSAGRTDRLAQAHRMRLSELGERSGLGSVLPQIDDLKHVHGNAAVVLQGLFMQAAKVLTFGLLVTLMVATLWMTGSYAISQIDGGFTLKALLFLLMNVFFLLAMVAFVGWSLLRSTRAPPRPLVRAAGRIAGFVNVPIVTFGHTHDEAVARIPNRRNPTGWFYNTGTWIAVFTHDELIPRERVQYTFLRIRDHAGELMHWSPGRCEAIPVILLEDDRAARPADAAA